MSPAVPVGILWGILALAFLGMWAGWRRRARKHDLPPLPTVEGTPTASVLLEAGGRYFGTTVRGDWLDRVVARGLGVRAGCRLVLGPEGLDVLRRRDPFRIPAAGLRGARHDQGIAGKVIPPHGVLVVSWQHGSWQLDSGFALDGREHDRWIRTIDELAKERTA